MTGTTGRGVGLALALLPVWSVLPVAPVSAQTVRAGIHALGITHTEIAPARRTEGSGLGGLISVRWRKWGLDISGHAARLDSVDGGPRQFTLHQGDLRVSYRVARAIALELGAGRRSIDPDFAAQDVGVTRAGLLTEIPLSSLGQVWARGAYLIAPRFSGGGTAGLAVELGFGAGLGTRNGRIRGRVEYEFQRIDRSVNDVAVPIQTSVAKVGMDIGF